jgi:hypothetical protein
MSPNDANYGDAFLASIFSASVYASVSEIDAALYPFQIAELSACSGASPYVSGCAEDFRFESRAKLRDLGRVGATTKDPE